MADTPIPHHATRQIYPDSEVGAVGRLRRERRFFPFFYSGALRASVVWRATLRRGRLSFVVPTLPLERLPACGGLSVDLYANLHGADLLGGRTFAKRISAARASETP